MSCSSPRDLPSQHTLPLETPCPEEAPAPPILPFHRAIHDLAEFWITQRPQPQRILVSPERIEQHNRRISGLKEGEWPVGRWDLVNHPFKGELVRERIQNKLKHFQKGVDRKIRVLANGLSPLALVKSMQEEILTHEAADEFRIVHHSTPLRCLPSDESVYEKPWQLSFDLMQCAQLRLGEVVRILAKGRRFWYVWSSYADGWVNPEALTPTISAQQISAYLHSDKWIVVVADHLPLWNEKAELVGEARLGAQFPLIAEEKNRLKILVPAKEGVIPWWILRSEKISIGYPSLTWENLLKVGFAALHTPYGWGGLGDNRDCSQLLMDLFSAFGIQLPRNTTYQAQAGLQQIEVGHLNQADKSKMIEETGAKGVVLLYLPGHIMFFLGKDQNRLYALHQFSGYLVPCLARDKNRGKSSFTGETRKETKEETMVRVNRTAVTALDLGRGGSRKSFLERIQRLIVFSDAASSP